MDLCLYTFGASSCLISDPLFLPGSLYMVIGSIVWSGVIVFVVAVVMSAGVGISVRAILTGSLDAG